MEFKNQNQFFILSFLTSFSLFYIFQQYAPTDLAAYIIGIFLVGIIPFILYFIWPKLNKKTFGVLLAICIFLAFKAFSFFDKSLIKYFFVEHKFDLIGVFISSFIISFFLKYKKVIIDRISSPERKIKNFKFSNNFFLFFSHLLVFFLISFLIYNPKYKYSFENLNLFGYESFHEYHHVTFFLIPIHEILSGKTLLINVSSLYGIFSTYFNSLVFSFIKLTYSNFVLYSTIISIVYSFLLFAILKKVTKSFCLALIGTLAYIRLAFFRDFPPNVEVFIYPSTTPIRHFFDILVFYSIFNYFKTKFDFKRLLILSTIVIFSFFYNFDFGLFILIAYIVTLLFDIFLSVYQRERIQTIILKFNRYTSSLVIPFIFFGLLLIVGTYLRSGVFPDFGQYLFHISTQIAQLADRSFPTVIGWQFLPLLIYLVAFYYIFYHHIINKQTDGHGLVFLLIYGILIFISYINLSEPNHLFPFLQSAVIIFILLLKTIKDRLILLKKYIFIFFLKIIFSLGILWAIFMYPYPFTDLITARINSRYSSNSTGYYYWGYPGTDFFLQDDDGKNFEIAAQKIRQLAKDDKQVVIISRYSALLYLMSGKTSLIDHPNIEYDIFSIQEFSEALNKIRVNRPRYIFVHSAVYNQWYIDIMDTLWNSIKDNYSLKENAGAIDVYQLKNN